MMYTYENRLLAQGYQYIAGTDEAGRGPMAGPLVVAAVVLDPNKKIPGLNDSKKLSFKKRESLFEQIIHDALEVKYIIVDSKTVDQKNVYQATKDAMKQCIMSLAKVDYCLSDAVKLDIDIPHEAIIKGDAKSASIAAASIIAKVVRDRYMIGLHEKYPQYGFNKHKGYVTKKHLQTIFEYGIIEEHRRSFRPVQEILTNNSYVNSK